MELRVNDVAIPQEIKILNFEELKTELEAKADYYGSLAYTDEQIEDAKADRAKLNKFKNTVNSERIKKEKEFMELFNGFKSQVNELIAIVEKPIAVIDERIAAYSDEQKAKKQKAIEELFSQIGFQNFVTLEKIWDPKWLNASTSMKSIEEQMRSRMYQMDKIRESKRMAQSRWRDKQKAKKSTVDSFVESTVDSTVDSTRYLVDDAEEEREEDKERDKREIKEVEEKSIMSCVVENYLIVAIDAVRN